MKNAVFSYVTPCGFCKILRFWGTYRLHHQCDKNQWARNNVSSNWQPTHATILVTLMMKTIHPSESSVLTRATRCNNSGNGILHGRVDIPSLEANESCRLGIYSKWRCLVLLGWGVCDIIPGISAVERRVPPFHIFLLLVSMVQILGSTNRCSCTTT
jgi:hypothetical protein